MTIELCKEEIQAIIRAFNEKDDEEYKLSLVEEQLLIRLGAIKMRNDWELIKK